jgi:thiamine pyrophosphate-dependent acetolactate synthase large subunit-like protein
VNRLAVLQAFGRVRGDAAVVVGPGLAGYELAASADGPMTLYNMDMAYVSATAVGMAFGAPGLKVVAVEGDGSLLMGLATVVSVARYAPTNLVILVFDNGVYLTTGSGRATTPTSTGTDIEDVARAAGMRHATTVTTLDAAAAALEKALATPGPWMIVAKVDTSDRERSGAFAPLPTDIFEGAQRFRRAFLERETAGAE